MTAPAGLPRPLRPGAWPCSSPVQSRNLGNTWGLTAPQALSLSSPALSSVISFSSLEGLTLYASALTPAASAAASGSPFSLSITCPHSQPCSALLLSPARRARSPAAVLDARLPAPPAPPWEGPAMSFLYPSHSHFLIHSCLRPEIIPILSYPSWSHKNLSNQTEPLSCLGFISNRPSSPPGRGSVGPATRQAGLHLFCL